MAGSARYTAILDANVLYPQLVRDTLLSLAVERLYHALWTDTIHDEWTRNLAKDRPELAAKLPQVVQLMTATLWPPPLRGMPTLSSPSTPKTFRPLDQPGAISARRDHSFLNTWTADDGRLASRSDHTHLIFRAI